MILNNPHFSLPNVRTIKIFVGCEFALNNSFFSIFELTKKITDTMSNKIEKLAELNNLYKSGAITSEELENLKKEILSDNNTSLDVNQNTSNNKTGEGHRIFLKSFNDANGKLINPPTIEYFDLNNISNKELDLIRPFIQMKQTHAPAEMTKDEIDICNKLFSIQEIAKMNSDRQGFNYGAAGIINVLCGGAVLYFINVSPCMIYLGAGSAGFASVFISLFILSRMDATIGDKILCAVSLIEIFVAIVLFNAGWKF